MTRDRSTTLAAYGVVFALIGVVLYFLAKYQLQ